MSIDLDKLIKAASGKLGMSEEQLRSAMRNGDMSAIRQHLGASDKERIDKAMKDRALTEELRKKL